MICVGSSRYFSVRVRTVHCESSALLGYCVGKKRCFWSAGEVLIKSDRLRLTRTRDVSNDLGSTWSRTVPNSSMTSRVRAGAENSAMMVSSRSMKSLKSIKSEQAD
jgi:hypothetical protein